MLCFVLTYHTFTQPFSFRLYTFVKEKEINVRDTALSLVLYEEWAEWLGIWWIKGA